MPHLGHLIPILALFLEVHLCSSLKLPFPPLLTLIQFPVPIPPPRKESCAIRLLSYLLNFITKHFGDHSAPRSCTSHQPLHT